MTTLNLTDSYEERGGDEVDVLGEDPTGGLLTAVLRPVLLHMLPAGVVWVSGPELRHGALVVLLSPAASQSATPDQRSEVNTVTCPHTVISGVVTLPGTVLGVNPPRYEVRSVRQTSDSHPRVGSCQPVSHVVTVQTNSKPTSTAAWYRPVNTVNLLPNK